MKIEKHVIIIVVIAILILILYLTHPMILEGALSSSSPETKITLITTQLNDQRYTNPTDPVIIGQKIKLQQTLLDTVNEILKIPKLKPDKKKSYEKMRNDTTSSIDKLKKDLDTAKKRVQDSRKK
jgi:hypothetical protein